MTEVLPLHRQLEELNMLECSLMPGESLEFIDNDDSSWRQLLDSYPDRTDEQTLPPSPARFQLRVEGAELYFEVEVPVTYPGNLSQPSILVRGDGISRSEQERWQSIVRERLQEVQDSEYPLYELMSTHLVPLLHEEAAAATAAETDRAPPEDVETSRSGHASSTPYHSLLTSHHLISPTKRRNLQQWSNQLNISGFAKVGYPGVIYCEGLQDAVEQFVANIKAMQWLALRVRFVEPAPQDAVTSTKPKRRWVELEKVGEVVEEMRRLGREKYVVEMGIGSVGQKS